MCPECMNTGRIRVIQQIGEFTHEREERCPCPIGQYQRVHVLVPDDDEADGKEATDLEERTEWTGRN